MTSAEHTTFLSRLGRNVATILTTHYTHPLAPSWEFVEPTEDHHSVYMRNRGTGARIYLSLSSSVGYDKNDRVNVDGWYHIGKNTSFVEVSKRDIGLDGWDRAPLPSITMSAAKNPEAIAKDISKRFLPDYLRIFEAAQRKVAEQEAYELRIANTLKRVAATAGFNVPKLGQYDRELRRETSGKVGSIEVSIKVYDERVELKLDDLTTPQAEAVIRFLKDHQRGWA